MSFRSLFALLIVIALGFALAFIILSIALLRGEIADLFPTALALEADQDLYLLLVWQAIALFVVLILISAGVFFAIGHLVAKPLKLLAQTMDGYAVRGEQMVVPEVGNAPTEIRSLAESFGAVVNRVDEAHKHDAEISRVKSDFISTAAHQLRTPLTGIRWALEALEKEPLTENQKVLVTSAIDKSKDLVGIVGTLLDISSIESGKYKYTFVPTDLHSLVQEVAADFSELAGKSKVSLFYAQEEGNGIPPVRIDRERVKWVLNNLIENAIRYTPASGTVRISLEPGEHRVFVKVKDTGIGIEAKDRANIFERFYRGGNAIAKENQGNGLGLYIARTIATDHGGDLNFSPNEDGPGTTFTLALPVAG